jgi:16S rRNA (uracil1498-N3)-methyltransferase
MSHFYLPADAWSEDGETLRLTGDEARHATQVRRHRVGDEISVLDGCGRRAVGRIKLLERDALTLGVERVMTTPAPVIPVTLVQAIPKGDTMEWIIEKAVELGVAEIWPVLTERTVIRMDEDAAVKKHQKWSRQLIEACKQCGQSHFPRLHVPVEIGSALRSIPTAGLRFVASLEADAKPLSQLMPQDSARPVTLAIGPEGDFHPDEYAAFRAAGWLAWTLGHLTLRCETAAISAVAILQHTLYQR